MVMQRKRYKRMHQLKAQLKAQEGDEAFSWLLAKLEEPKSISISIYWERRRFISDEGIKYTALTQHCSRR